MRKSITWFSAVALAAFYCAISTAYVFNFPLVMDEFDGAYDVRRLLYEIPYRDFKPYKTVLGYYYQSLALVFSHSIWQGLLLIKFQMFLTCCLVLTWAGWRLARIYNVIPVIFGLGMLATQSTWLERSTELRVDTLTALVGLVSLIYLLERRVKIAGLLAGLSFLVSQKGLYFCLAGCLALLIPHFIAAARAGNFDWRLGRPALRFAVFAVLPIGCYFAVAWLLGLGAKAAEATFLSHYKIVFTQIYDNRWLFWRQTLLRDPVFFLSAVGGGLLFDSPFCSNRPYSDLQPESQLLAYSIVLLLCCLWHKQPWPYFFVILLPTLAVLQVAGAAAALSIRSGVGILLLLLLVQYSSQITRLNQMLDLDNKYQRQNIDVAERIFKSGDSYLAGVDILYNFQQTHPRLRRLSKDRRETLRRTPEPEAERILAELKKLPPKLLLTNYRLRGSLPQNVRKYFSANYTHFWGSIKIYAPTVSPSRPLVTVAHPGRYRLEGEPGANFSLLGKPMAAGEEVELERGYYQVRADKPVRLVFQPGDVLDGTDPAFAEKRTFFSRRYEDRELE